MELISLGFSVSSRDESDDFFFLRRGKVGVSSTGIGSASGNGKGRKFHVGNRLVERTKRSPILTRSLNFTSLFFRPLVQFQGSHPKTKVEFHDFSMTFHDDL
jgi:hypothetical protein